MDERRGREGAHLPHQGVRGGGPDQCRPPATSLLFGPPGTGKTTFVRAIASRLGWPFIALLMSIPEFRSRPGRLLVCATNLVDTIDPAVLRPGRFDLLIGNGPPDHEALPALWTQAVASLDLSEEIDPGHLADRSRGCTPGASDLATQRAAAVVFDRSRADVGDERVALADVEAALARTRASISTQMQERFDTQLEEYQRV